MCLTGKNLTVALVTIHVALADVPGLLRQEEIVRVGRLCWQIFAGNVASNRHGLLSAG